MSANSVRCQAKYHLDVNPTGGNVIMILEGNKIYVKDSTGKCGRWTQLALNVPGIVLDFSKVGFVQKTMPKNFSIGGCQPPVPPKRIPAVVIGE